MAAAFPDWNDLRDILLIAEAGSLSAAARAAGVSQSTMSRRLAAIEQGGQSIFLRDEAGRMTPNARGRAMMRAAREMRQPYEALRREMGEAPLLRLVACEVAARLLLSPALPLWRAKSDISTSLGVSEAPLQADFDVAVAVMPAIPAYCTGLSLGHLDWALYASPAYVAAERIRGRIERLDGHRVIRASGALAEISAFRWLAGQGGVTAMLVGGLEAMVEGCAGGMGLALLPVALASAEPRLLAVDGPACPATEVWAMARAEQGNEPQIAAFLKWARGQFRAPGHRRAG